jgi:hypothetical protein
MQAFVGMILIIIGSIAVWYMIPKYPECNSPEVYTILTDVGKTEMAKAKIISHIPEGTQYEFAENALKRDEDGSRVCSTNFNLTYSKDNKKTLPMEFIMTFKNKDQITFGKFIESPKVWFDNFKDRNYDLVIKNFW